MKCPVESCADEIRALLEKYKLAGACTITSLSEGISFAHIPKLYGVDCDIDVCKLSFETDESKIVQKPQQRGSRLLLNFYVSASELAGSLMRAIRRAEPVSQRLFSLVHDQVPGPSRLKKD